MRLKPILLALASFAAAATSMASTSNAPSWFDRSHTIFFPPKLHETVTVSQAFPVFWWNFVVLDFPDSKKSVDWSKAQALCSQLKALTPELLLRAECNPGLEELQGFVTDWAADLPLRTDRPSDSGIRDHLDAALAKASLPTGDRALIRFLQVDPMESWLELKKLVESRLKIPLKRTQGFFYDEAARRVVIPVQAAFDPTDTAKTAQLLSQLYSANSEGLSVIGPHASTYMNQEQVTRDLGAVSKAGYVILALIAAGLLFFKRWRLFLLFPPVFLAVGIAAGVTVLIFGSIHGLTLSLGAGIIGLALDYGFNAVMNDASVEKQTRRSNWVGLLTTLVGLFVLMTSSIPLLRQMMVFAAVGLVAGFFIFDFLIRKCSSLFRLKPLDVTFAPTPFKTRLIVGLLFASLAGLALLRPNLDMKQFDFQDAKTRSVAAWLYQTLSLRPPLFSVNRGPQSLDQAIAERAWATQQGISLENLANYIPAPATQAAHIRSWQAEPCQKTVSLLNETQKKFFSRFIEQTLCRPTAPRLVSADWIRAYTAHLNSGDRWITLWLPSSDEQEALLRKQRPDVKSLREVILAFPQTLASELIWMAPLSVLIVLLILLFYYRSVVIALIALVPFFSGLGLFTLAVFALRLDVSFISVIALVMSFGFSFDYAIFSTDRLVFKNAGVKDGVWEAISSAAFTTWVGFAPLLFCHHPVLQHLGQALCISTVGCYLGAVWGVPGLMKRAQAGKASQ